MLFSIFIIAIGSFTSTVYSSSCNPLETTCPSDPALGKSIKLDLTGPSSYFTASTNNGNYTYTETGLELSIEKRLDNPTIKSDFYIMYGKVETVIKAAKGTGIVSTIVFESDIGDEIDFEWLGGNDYNNQGQTNFFSKGNVDDNNKTNSHYINSPQDEFHTYTIDWSMEKLVWYVDGVKVRTVKNTTSKGYPQTPQYIKVGIWAAGDSSNSEGTIEWAGGKTNYDNVPFTMYIQSIIVEDYSTGTEYKYTDKSGDWSSIEAIDGKINGRIDKANDITTIKPSSTAVSSTQTTTNGISSTEPPYFVFPTESIFLQTKTKTTLTSTGVSSSSSSGSSGTRNGTNSTNQSSAGHNSGSRIIAFSDKTLPLFLFIVIFSTLI